MKITIRPACPADKDSVLAFTRKTWTWGDYIEDAWDGWLNTANGELAVAEAAQQPIAIAMTVLPSPGEGWLQGLRVHPDYRRQGIAKQLTAYQLGWLRQRGAAVARLAVHCANVASQSLVTRTGFRHVTTFAIREQPVTALGETGADAITLASADVDAAWAWITASPTWRAAAGLWADNWTWRRLTLPLLVEQAAQDQLVGVREGEDWGALAISLLDDHGQHIGYVDGAGAALDELARALTTRAWEGRAQYNTAMLPPAPQLAPAFERAGYAPEDEGSAMYIYELDL